MITFPARGLATAVALLLLAAGCADDGDDDGAGAPPLGSTVDGGDPSTSSTVPATTSVADETATAPSGGESDGATVSTPWPEAPRSGDGVRRWTIEVVDRLDHDIPAFTQGLEVHDGVGYEGTGRRGQSVLRRFDPTTGVVADAVSLDPELFGEGITVVDETIVQLTLDAGIALRWDLASLEPLDPFTYEGSGWGLCATSEWMVMTDGTAEVQRRDPGSFTVLDEVEVTFDGVAVSRLNELECIDQLVVANVWKENRLVVFDPTDGAIVADIDGAPLEAEVAAELADPEADVLNGVADLGDGTLLLTGKNWPVMFRVRLMTS